MNKVFFLSDILIVVHFSKLDYIPLSPQVTVDLNTDVQESFKRSGYSIRISQFHILVKLKLLLDEFSISKHVLAASMLVFKSTTLIQR